MINKARFPTNRLAPPALPYGRAHRQSTQTESYGKQVAWPGDNSRAILASGCLSSQQDGACGRVPKVEFRSGFCDPGREFQCILSRTYSQILIGLFLFTSPSGPPAFHPYKASFHPGSLCKQSLGFSAAGPHRSSPLCQPRRR